MGTRSLTSPKITVSLTGSVVNQMTVNTSRQATSAFEFKREISFATGVSLNQANRAWEFEGLINSGGFVVIDLFDYAGFDTGSGAGDDFVGQPLIVEEVVAVMIGNENAALSQDPPAGTGQLEIIPDATNGWTPIGSHTVATGGALRSQGVMIKVQPAELGFDVTDASNHRIRLDAVGGDVNYKITILGRNDDNESSSSSSSLSSASSSSSLSSSSPSSVSSSSSNSSSSSSPSSSSSNSSNSSSSSSISSSSLSSISSSSISSSSVSSESSSSSASVSENSSSSPSSSSVP